MKAILFSILVLFSISLSAQSSQNKILLASSDEVSLYLIGKDSIMTGKNRILVVSHSGKDYRLAVSGGSIVKKEGFWVIYPSRSVKSIGIGVYFDYGKKIRSVMYTKHKVVESPQDRRRRELGLK